MGPVRLCVQGASAVVCHGNSLSCIPSRNNYHCKTLTKQGVASSNIAKHYYR